MSMTKISQERDRRRQYGLYGPLAIFSGTANPELAQQIADRLEKPLGRVTIRQFANENVFAQLEESVRGKDVFLIQPTCSGLRYRKHRAGECVIEPQLVAAAQRRRIRSSSRLGQRQHPGTAGAAGHAAP